RQSAVEVPRARTARAVFLHGIDHRLFDLEMIGQTEVVIRADHDHPAAINDGFCALLRFDHFEIGIPSHLTGDRCLSEITAFLKEFHVCSVYKCDVSPSPATRESLTAC